MQFEVIRKSHKKEIIIGAVVFILISIVFIVHQSFAKYQTTKNMKIAEGTINYKIPDFNVIAMYKNDGVGDVEITTMPESGYIINENKSYCNLNGSKDNNAKLYTDENGNHVISKLSKGDKCYLYFDKKFCKGAECILPNVTVKTGTPNFAAVATTDEGVYKALDDDGVTYYFRGAVTNNYVKFANKYWRIIRINGDGTIRLIYQGTSATSTGSDAQIGTSKFNTSYNNNMYVGFKYTSDQAQGTGTKSTILGVLETWYDNNLSSYTNKLDTNAGFCGDRRRSTTDGGAPNGTGGTGTTSTCYAARYRLYNNKMPELSCETADFYTVSGASKGNKSLEKPIGLITADEVAMAGGIYGSNNQNYYLYAGATYWTMSPFTSIASVFYVSSYGSLNYYKNVSDTFWVRPVINLRSDVTLTGKGTASDPYVVQ